MKSYLDRYIDAGNNKFVIVDPSENIELSDFLLQEFDTYIDAPLHGIVTNTIIRNADVSIVGIGYSDKFHHVDFTAMSFDDGTFKLNPNYFKLYLADDGIIDEPTEHRGLLLTNIISLANDNNAQCSYPTAFVTKYCEKCGKITAMYNTIDDGIHFCFNCSTLTYRTNYTENTSIHITRNTSVNNATYTNVLSTIYWLNNKGYTIYHNNKIRDTHCVYICPNCRTVYTNLTERKCIMCHYENDTDICDSDTNEQLIIVDPDIVPSLEVLWDHDIATMYSCAGVHSNHFFQGHLVSDQDDAYLMMDLNNLKLPCDTEHSVSTIKNIHNWFISRHPTIRYEIHNTPDNELVLTLRSYEALDELHNCIVDLCDSQPMDS